MKDEIDVAGETPGPQALARRGPGAVAAPAAADPEARTRRTVSASRLIVFMATLAVGSLAAVAGVGYLFARHSDAIHADEHRAALRASLGEIRTMVVAGDTIDPRIVRLLEQSAGVSSLRFQAQPPAERSESQPVLDGNGRIVGFLTWQPDFPLTQAAGRLLPVVAGVAFALLILAAYSLRQLRHARLELAANEARARQAISTDALTGLANEHGMHEALAAALAERDIRRVVAFAVIELGGVSDAQRQIGSARRGELLVAVAARLAETLPPEAMLGRGGGDRFLILMRDLDLAPALRAAVDAVARPHWLNTVVRLSAHAGYAQAPRDGVTREDLIRAADQALRAAAGKGPGTVTAFDRAIEAVSDEQQFIRRELPRALTAAELELHYQPIVSADGAQIVGVEALLRWTHATRGAIPPATFIPVAEQMGLMDPLGEFVLRRALADAQRWPNYYVAVNLSPVQVRDRSIVDMVRHALDEAKVQPSRLMLEITEGVLIENPDEMVKRIQDLRALGVRIALDDFGSGYSNLSYLQRFPIDKLKIDKAFVDPLGRSPNGGVIVQAIVALGRALGLTVLVEGVEREEQRVLLRLAGCDEMQGYLFARPAPAKAIDRLAAQRKPAPAAPAVPPLPVAAAVTA